MVRARLTRSNSLMASFNRIANKVGIKKMDSMYHIYINNLPFFTKITALMR